MNPFGLPDHRLAAFARPVLEYLPAGFDAEEAEQAEIDDVGSLATLASPNVVAARIARLGVNVSTENMTERLLETSDEHTLVSGLRLPQPRSGLPVRGGQHYCPGERPIGC